MIAACDNSLVTKTLFSGAAISLFRVFVFKTMTITKKERYNQYIKSPEWKHLRDLAIEETPYCVMCSAEDELQVHHRKYPVLLGTEPLSWLTVVCRKCHARHHGYKYRKPKKKKKQRAKNKEKPKIEIARSAVKHFTKKEIAEYEKIYKIG